MYILKIMGTENKYIVKILKTNDELVKGIKGVAEQLNKKFPSKDEEVVLITILKGGLPFSLELMKHIDFDMTMDFISASSYYLDKQSDEVKTTYQATRPIEGKHVIICDDLIDSGNTIIKVGKILEAYKPKSISVAALWGKTTRAKISYDEHYAFDGDPGGFLLGFGLDYDEKYRNLPYVAIMEDKDEK